MLKAGAERPDTGYDRLTITAIHIIIICIITPKLASSHPAFSERKEKTGHLLAYNLRQGTDLLLLKISDTCAIAFCQGQVVATDPFDESMTKYKPISSPRSTKPLHAT